MPSEDATAKPSIDTISCKIETGIQTVPSPHCRRSNLEATPEPIIPRLPNSAVVKHIASSASMLMAKNL